MSIKFTKEDIDRADIFDQKARENVRMLTYQDGDGECEKEQSEWTPAADRPRRPRQVAAAEKSA